METHPAPGQMLWITGVPPGPRPPTGHTRHTEDQRPARRTGRRLQWRGAKCVKEGARSDTKKQSPTGERVKGIRTTLKTCGKVYMDHKKKQRKSSFWYVVEKRCCGKMHAPHKKNVVVANCRDKVNTYHFKTPLWQNERVPQKTLS